MSQRMTIRRIAVAMGANLSDADVGSVVEMLDRIESADQKPRDAIEDAILKVAMERR